MKTISWLIMFGLSVMLIPEAIFAGGPGTTGAAYLKPAQNARAAAMGGIQAVPMDGESAIFSNPGGLTYADKVGFTCSYVSWFQDISFGNISLVYPGDKLSFGLGAIYLNYGDIPGYDVNANPTSDFGAHDLCGLLGIGYDLGNGIRFGGTVKFINEKIEEESAFGLGLDIGGLYHFQNLPLRLGAVLQHMGLVDMRFVEEDTPWPTLMRFGAAYSALDDALIFAAEANSVLGDETHFDGGVEYIYDEMFALRLGYRTGPSDVGSGLCAGAGFYWKQYGVNYAFEPYGVLGNTHRFSILIQV
ncbi:hypothetical protein CEE37_05835 [candidate division LCP-89 bacterium B3_LCP]|uniref:PorV/PorQ family protein n=1 Tax=candidate division LCP-89 bacterium B3_LCP TaxID=2012998 RepID=A0A532V1T3_UNCL8|nr:MAG: hypothetical protein CEE37_05835 [candidate division LCP-89 bacterium B3_LCP]